MEVRIRLLTILLLMNTLFMSYSQDSDQSFSKIKVYDPYTFEIVDMNIDTTHNKLIYTIVISDKNIFRQIELKAVNDSILLMKDIIKNENDSLSILLNFANIQTHSGWGWELDSVLFLNSSCNVTQFVDMGNYVISMFVLKPNKKYDIQYYIKFYNYFNINKIYFFSDYLLLTLKNKNMLLGEDDRPEISFVTRGQKMKFYKIHIQDYCINAKRYNIMQYNVRLINRD